MSGLEPPPGHGGHPQQPRRHPARQCLTLCEWLLLQPLTGEQADQVVEAVAARAAVLEQAQVDKVVQRVPGILDRHPAGDRGEGGIGVLAGHHGEPPEHPLPRLIELLVRHLERVGDLQVAGLELTEAVLLVRQPGGEFGRVPAGPASQPVPDDPQRQRQASAQLGDPVSAASSSRAERSPRIPVSSCLASGNGRGPRTSLRTPSRPASNRRVVIRTLPAPSPGRSGRTCSSDAALSRRGERAGPAAATGTRTRVPGHRPGSAGPSHREREPAAEARRRRPGDAGTCRTGQGRTPRRESPAAGRARRGRRTWSSPVPRSR